MVDMEPAVAVEDLSRHFGDFVAVDRVTLQVARGEIFGFLGPNGAGKTTTIKMLTGLLSPTSGTGRVAGLDIKTERESLRANIGYMSQKFSLYSDLTVSENIEFFAGIYGVIGEHFDERRNWALQMAHLDGKEHELTGDLPLGWKQRLALGCAVLHEPPILFLDEPTSGVDPQARRTFWDLIDGLAEAGTTVFVSTHYMEEAEHCNRLALMNRGKLIALDSPEAIRAAMTSPLVRVPVADPRLAVEALRDHPKVLEASMYGRDIRVVLERDEDALESVAAALRDQGLTPGAMEQLSPSLEDVFVSLVREQGGARVG